MVGDLESSINVLYHSLGHLLQSRLPQCNQDTVNTQAYQSLQQSYLTLCYLLFSSAFAGWIDWNLLVDYEGGPNHLGNMCDAPIVTLEDFSDVHVQPKYYYFGHISKFVPPGSVRVESHTVGECGNRYAPIKMRRDDMT